MLRLSVERVLPYSFFRFFRYRVFSPCLHWVAVGILLVCFSLGNLFAQVSGYTFSQSSTTYTEITGTGATPVLMVTATANSGSGSMDSYSALATIPFTFTINGIGHTSCTVNSNGFITFGGTAPSAFTTTPISGTGTYQAAVAAWASDINGMFNVGGRTSTIRYETEGTAPNRRFIIQFKDFRPAYTTSTTLAPYINFQIILSETSNQIQIVYGPSGLAVGTSNTSRTMQIGLRGATNTDFNNRTNSTSVAFGASTAGTLNSSTQAYSSVNATPGQPANGLTYTWAPPVPCSATPTPGNTLSTSNTVCAGASFTLSLQNATSGTGVSYQWQSSSDNSTWADITGATAATSVQTQTSATYYRCNVTCSGNGTGASNAVFIAMVQDFSTCYCTSNATSTADEEIFNVTLGTLNNTSDCSTLAPGTGSVNRQYSNYTTSVAAPVLYINSSVNFSVDANTCGGNYSNRVSIFIDFNRNGSFLDSGEEVYTGPTLTGPALRTGSFIVPLGSDTGLTRMRVIQVETTGAITPCGTYSWGETEDYLVNLQPLVPPNCATLLTPAQNATGICFNGNGTTLNWSGDFTSGPVTGYKVYFGTDNPPTNIVNGTNIGMDTFYVTGALSASTTYYWNIVPTGPGGDAVSCTSIRSFTTDANACVPPNCSAGYTSPINGSSFLDAATQTLTWLAPSGGTPPTGYRVYFGTDNPPTNIQNGSNVGNVLSWATGTLLGDTTYYWRIVPTNATGDATGCNTVDSFSTRPVYCTSTATTSFDEFLSNVTVGTLNNSSLCATLAPGPGSVASRYSNYTGLTPTNLLIGTSIPFSVSSGTCGGNYNNRIFIFIDFNQDGDFTDAGENVWQGTAISGPHTDAGTFLVPQTALPGNTMMRVIVVETTGSVNPCGTYSYGETEDYVVNFQIPPAPNCATLNAPANNATGVCFNGNGTTLTWSAPGTGGPVSGYRVYFGTDNPPTNIANGTNIGLDTFYITGTLSANTTYYWYIVPTGLGGDASGCTTPRAFTTDINACLPPNCSAGYTGPLNGSTFLDAATQTLTWLAPSGGTPPTGYRIYFGTDNPPTNVQNGSNVGNVLSWATGTLLGDTTYYWRIVPTNATGDATGCNTVDSFSTRPVYCTSTATSSSDEFLSNITLGSLNNTSVCTTLAPGPGSVASRYSNYTGLTPPSLTLGSNVPFSVSSGTCGGNYTNRIFIFIDFNQDGDFTDAGENVWQGPALTGPHTDTGTFPAPLGGPAGLTLMRVIVVETSGAITPCGTYSWGETEDYVVNLVQPPLCTGTPAPGNTLSSVSEVCSGSNFTLSLQNQFTDLGISYQWESSSDSLIWNTIAGATNATLLRTMSSTEYFRAIVACQYGGVDTSALIRVDSAAFYQCLYCASSANNATDEVITRVNIGSMDNVTSCGSIAPGPGSILNRYSNYRTSIAPVNIDIGLPVNFNLGAGTCGGNFTTVMTLYIDFNRDGDYTDAGELAYQGPAQTGPYTLTGQFTVPLNAQPGITGMRVILIESSIPQPPCGTYGWGETEDYLVNLVIPPPCSGQPVIAAISADQTLCYGSVATLTVSGVTVGLDISNQWQQSTDGGLTWQSASGGSGANTYAYTLPNQFTPILYRFTATCSNGPVTAESNPVTISISNAPSAFATLPYSQDFENWANVCNLSDRPDANFSVLIPNLGNSAWRRHDQGNTANWTNQNLGIYSPVSSLGNSSARFHSYLNADSGSIYFYVDCSVSGTKSVTFDYLTNTGGDYLKVLYSTDGGQSFAVLADSLITGSNWTAFNQTLPSNSAQTIVVIRAVGNGSNTTDIGLDNVVISVPCTGTPVAGTNPTFTGLCSGSSTQLVVTGASAGSGITYQWEEFDGVNWITAVGGTGANTTAYTTPALIANRQYRLAVACTNSSQTINGAPLTAQVLACTYSISRTTGITYNSIIGNGGIPITSWRGGTSADDNYSAMLPIGFDFFYKGSRRSDFFVSTNGWMSFNPLITSSFFSNISTSVTQGLAPFWDDLVCLGNSPGNLNSSIYYMVSGTAPNRVLTVEWRNMETFGNAGPNLNFQVKLYEANQNIEYVYGEMEGFDGTTNYSFSYSTGLVGNTSGDYQWQRFDNLQNFSSSVTTSNLTRVPVCNTRITFTDGAYTVGDLGYTAPSNDEPANAIVLNANTGPCTDLCGTYFTSRLATGSTTPGLAPALAGTTASGDVFFTFTTSTITDYQIVVRGAGGYNPVVQLLNSDLSLNGTNQVNATGLGLTETLNLNGLSPNTQYYIRIYHATGSTGTDGTFSVCLSEIVPPPVNDNPAGAILITAGSVCNPTSSPLPNALVATASGQTTCSGTADDDIWYKFVAPVANPVITVNSGVGYNAVLSLFSNALVSLNCVNTTSTGGQEVISPTNLTIGDTFYIRVFHFAAGAGSGNFSICITATTPQCISSVTPPNNTPGILSSQVLSWSPALGATGYDVYLGTNQGLVNAEDSSVRVSPNQVGTSFTASGLISGTTYYWKAVPRNNVGATSGCSSVLFHTAPASVSAISSSSAFICNGSSSTLTVANQGGTLYWFTDSCQSNINQSIGTGQSLIVTPTVNTNYFVRGFYQGVWSATCAQTSITVIPSVSAPAAPIVSGTPGCSDFSMTWNAVSGAAFYQVDVASDSLFTQFTGIYQNLNVGNLTTLQVTGLSPNTPYFVRVRAVASLSGTDCPGASSSRLQVSTASSPIQVFNVTGGGAICGSGSAVVGLQNSAPGILYRLLRNGTTVVDSLTGTGFMLQFTPLTQAGTYTVIAEANLQGCASAAMNGTAIVQVFSQPISVTSGSTNETCRNSGTGSVTATASGGSGQFAYLWSNGGQTAQLTGLRSNTYTVTVTDLVCNQLSPVHSTVIVNANWGANAGADIFTCVGSSVSRTGTIIGSVSSPVYTWFRPNNTQQNNALITLNNITTNEAGNYVLRVIAGGCTSFDTLPIVVNTPVGNAIAGANSLVCTGGQIQLTAGTVVGAQYAWQGPNAFTSSMQNPVIPNAVLAAGGRYTLSVSTPGCSGALTDTVSVHVVQANPVTLSSNSPVCQGGVVYLNVNAVPGNTGYNWSGPMAYTSVQQNPSLTNVAPNRTGIYSLSVFQSACNMNMVYTTHVTVGGNPTLATASSNSPICTNNTLQFSVVMVPSATYVWSGPSGFTSALQNPAIFPAGTIHAGQYSLVVNSPGCNSTSRIVNVTVEPALTLSISSNSPVCQGQPLYLNSSVNNTGITYAWSGPNGFSSALAGPAINQASLAESGIYTLVASKPGCPSLTISTPVTVSPSVTGVTAGLNSPICVGANLNLTATSITGVTYLWTGPNGFTSANPAPSVLNAQTINSGQYIVTASSPGCSSISRTLTSVVNAPAVLNAGSNSPICAGAVLNLSSGVVSSNVAYSWQGPSGFSSQLPAPAIINATTGQSGIYSVTATQPGCGSVSATVVVSVGSQINNLTLSANSPLCSGQNLQLSSTPIPNSTVVWSAPDGFTSDQVSPVRNTILSNQGGVYTLQVTSPGCGSSSRTLTVIVNEAPVISAGTNAPICESSVLSLTCNTISGATYQWAGPNSYVASVQNASIANCTPANSGVYTLSVSVPGCGTTTTTVAATVGAALSNIVPRSNSPVCLNGTLNLSALNRSGVTYVWAGPGGFTAATATATRNSMTSAEAGVYTMTINSPGCGSVTNSLAVGVNNPAAVSASNNSPVCGGAVVTLSGTGNRSSTYVWSGPNSFSATTSSVSINNAQPSDAGVYTLSVTDPACGILTATTTVAVGANLNAATPSSNSPVCQGITIQLSAGFVAGANYSWIGPDNFTSNSQNPVIPNAGFVNAGEYTLTVSSNGCPTVVRTTSVTVLPAISATATNSSPVCQGSVVYLNAGFAPNAVYAWSGPNGFISSVRNPALVNAQPLSSGTYTLTVTLPGCNTSTATTVVQVGAQLNGVSITGNSPVCSGSNLNLTATQNVGYTYSWTGPNGFTSTVSNPQILSATTANAGVYNLSVVSAGCGTTTRSYSASITDAPVVTAGSNSPICQGNVLYLNVNSIAGSTYSWSGPNGYISSVQNPGVSNAQPIASGTYIVQVNTPACGVISATTVVAVNSNLLGVNILSNSPVCAGGSILMTAMQRPGFTYSWTGPNGFTSTDAAPQTLTNVTTANQGTYTAVFTSPGCGSTSRSVSIRVNDPTQVTANANTPVCVNGVIYFAGIAPSGSTFSWAGPGGFTSSLRSPSRTRVQLGHAGVYTLSANVPGCGVVTATTTVVVQSCKEGNTSTPKDNIYGEASESIESLLLNDKPEVMGILNDAFKFTVWPNPANGEWVHVKWEGLSGKDRNISVKIYDATGKVIFVKSVNRDTDMQESLEDTLEFSVPMAKGLYTVETVFDGFRKYEKLIVE